VLMILLYLFLVEIAKKRFFARIVAGHVVAKRRVISERHRVGRRAGRFSHRPTPNRGNRKTNA
jgi:hypothetical protein